MNILKFGMVFVGLTMLGAATAMAVETTNQGSVKCPGINDRTNAAHTEETPASGKGTGSSATAAESGATDKPDTTTPPPASPKKK